MILLRLGYMKSPLHKIGDNVTKFMNEDTAVHGVQIVRDDDTSTSPQSPNVHTEEKIQEGNLGRGHCKKEISILLRDYVINIIKKMSPSYSTPPAQSRSSGTPYPITHYVNCDKFSSYHRTFLEAIETECKLVTYYEVIKDKSWRPAMDSELEALERNQTWMIEELPSNKKTLGCRWVYKKNQQVSEANDDTNNDDVGYMRQPIEDEA
ncbi:retrovirus-related pol polyprotein from transposon TNT 1-94 [Tanacetum coccineum]|uniref:Retrovirus-related pol polyprotein from transposon TNT 1-94 n=1 Tax=Tanacetum coccineum TaxID=301880 RepID=A0ABQ5HGI0_9ASTR